MAITAPSASNKQPWRFFVSDEKSMIEAMVAEVQRAVVRLSKQVRGPLKGRFEEYGDYFVRFGEAPVVVVAAYRPLSMLSSLVDEGLAGRERDSLLEMERDSALVSTAMAVQNLLLFAHSVGLGASCLTGPLVAETALCQLLSIPRGWKIAAVVAVGYPDEIPEATTRKSVEAVLRWVE
jgi:nitroreductase